MGRLSIRSIPQRPLIVFLVSFLIDLGSGSVNFSVPLYAYRLGAPQYLIGLIASTFGLVYIFSAIYSPRMVFGRRLDRAIALLLASYMVIAASYLLVRMPVLFVVMRGFEGLVLGNLYPLTDTLPASAEGDGDLVPWYNAGWALSYIVAPVTLGYLISVFGFRASFEFASLSVLVALVVVAAASQRLGLNREATRPPTQIIPQGRVVDEVVTPAFIAGFVTAVFSSLYPAYLASQHFSYELIGVVSGSMSASRTFTLALAGKMQAALGTGRIKSLGYTFSALIAIPTLLHGVVEQLVCAVTVGLGVGLLYHVSLSGSLTHPKEYLTNTFEASLATGFFSGPLLGAALSGLAPSYVYIGVSLVPLATLVRSARRRR